MRAYDLDMPLLLRVFPFAMLLLLTVGVPIPLVKSGPTLLLLPWLAIMSWNWWIMATLVYRVILHDDGTLEWVALGRRVQTRPEDIREIRPERGGIGLFVMKHADGKVRFINQITGFHEVLVHIKSRNQAVTLRGC